MKTDPQARAAMQDLFLFTHDRHGHYGTNSFKEPNTDVRPGVTMEAGDAPFMRVSYYDGLEVAHVFLPVLLVGNVTARFMDEAVSILPSLAADWEEAHRGTGPELRWVISVIHDDGPLDIPLVMARSPLDAWNKVLAQIAGNVSLPVNTPPPFVHDDGACHLTSHVFTSQGEQFSSKPYHFSAHPFN